MKNFECRHASRWLTMTVLVFLTFGVLASALSSCGLLGGVAEGNVTIVLPRTNYWGGGRSISDGDKERLKEEIASYRVTLNSTVLEGAGGRFSASFPVGTTVDITVECLNSSRAVVIRTATKTITITSGINTVNINLSQDGTEIAAPPTPATGRVKYYGGEGAQNIPNDTNTYETGEDVTLMTLQQEPTRSGYIFNGWTANVELTGWKGWDNRIEVSLPIGQAFSAVYNQSPGSPENVEGFVMPDVSVVLTAQWRDAAASVTIDGFETNFEDFTNAWDYANGQTATIKMYQNATDVSISVDSGNVTLDLNGKTLEGKGSSALRSVIQIQSGSSLTLKDTGTGGKITGGGALQTSNVFGGGGVFVYDNATFIMEGGLITGNTASVPRNDGSSYGGGVLNRGTFLMSGGAISGNDVSGQGGGVANFGTFTMTGGIIGVNTASKSGPGVYAVSRSVQISGKVMIAGCGSTITLVGRLDAASRISVARTDAGVFTSGWSTYKGSAVATTVFTSDVAGMTVAENSGEVELR